MVRIAYNLIGHSDTQIYQVQTDVVRIGSDPNSNDVVLSSPTVSPRHAVLSRNGPHWELTPLGENDVLVGGNELRHGERAVISARDAIRIYPFSLVIEGIDDHDSDISPQAQLDEQVAQFILAIHGQLLGRMDLADTSEERRQSDQYLLKLEEDIDELARLNGLFSESSRSMLLHCAGHAVQSHILNAIIEGQRSDAWGGDERWTKMQTAAPELEGEMKLLAQNSEKSISSDSIEDISARMEKIESEFWDGWMEVLKQRQMDADSTSIQYLAKRYLKKQIKDILFGYGPLEDLIRMPTVSEIMVVSRDKIYVEKQGVLEKSGRRFVSDDVTEAIIDRIVSRVDRRIDKANPLVDARLLDGSRVNAIIMPLALSGPCLTIRKFPAQKLMVRDLINYGSLSQVAADFLEAAVISGKNVLISGGTGTGKTTLLNCLSDFIPDKDRIVTIEDTAELRLQKEHVVRLETKIANVEGKGAYTIRDLVKNSLRMRPDRIVVGECRGAEALDMLQAMNTGHDGSMTTIHANTSEDVIQRLEVLVQYAEDLPVDSIHRQIASAIDLVVQLTRMRDGRRAVTQITEFVDYDQQEEQIRIKDLFRLEGESADSMLMPTGSLPTFMGDLIEEGLITLENFYR